MSKFTGHLMPWRDRPVEESLRLFEVIYMYHVMLVVQLSDCLVVYTKFDFSLILIFSLC